MIYPKNVYIKTIKYINIYRDEYVMMYKELFKKYVDNRYYLGSITDQTRPDQTRPDQTRPDQTRPDQTRPIEIWLEYIKDNILIYKKLQPMLRI